jgi:uncharacterized protein (TIGR03067 family)
VAGEQDGDVQQDAKDHLLTFNGDKFTVKKGDRVFAKGTFTIDPSRSPKTIDMKITEGPVEDGKEVKVFGIYELRDGTLKWCVGRPGDGDRPQKFTTKEGSAHLFVTLKKEK